MNKGVCRVTVLWLFVFSLAVLLPGCGKKGPLYLPEATPTPGAPAATVTEPQGPAELQTPGPAGQTQP